MKKFVCKYLTFEGIIKGNDPFLYGVKAYLRRGARPLRGERVYPNDKVGHGVLCLKESLPEQMVCCSGITFV